MCETKLKRIFKIFVAILILVFIFLCLHPFLHKGSETDMMEQLKFKDLVFCLTSTGVNEENIIHRNSGVLYNKLNWQWSTLNGLITPMAYLVAKNVSDIQNAIKCCRQLNIRPVARSGGHSFEKHSFGDSDSLILDLTNLNHISIDPASMTCDIQAGARVGYIYYKLWNEGQYMISTGICPSVGVAGLTLGGGYGYFTRHLGLSSDNLIQLEMIDTKGELLVVNNSTNKDLFWALRGGGGGSFGIVTNFKFKMYSAPKLIDYGIFEYAIEDFSELFYAWQSLITSSVSEYVGAVLTIVPSYIKMEIYNVNYAESDNTTFEEILNSFSFPNHTAQLVELLNYTDFLLATSGMLHTNQISDVSDLQNITKEYMPGFHKIKSFYVDKILEKEDISKLYVLLTALDKFTTVLVEPNGGAINKLSQSETAFIHRSDNLYLIQLSFYNKEGVDVAASSAAMKRFYEESKAIFNHRESYQNYLDQDMPDYLERYYGENLKKLIQVKTRIDPENIFHHPQSIPVNSSFFG